MRVTLPSTAGRTKVTLYRDLVPVAEYEFLNANPATLLQVEVDDHSIAESDRQRANLGLVRDSSP
jgi:hypothetical protein